MAAYVIANVEITNPEEYKQYLNLNTPLVAQYGGKFVVRGGKVEVLEGAFTAHRVVLIEFPSGEAARAWYHSPEYGEAMQYRHRNAVTHLLAIVENP